MRAQLLDLRQDVAPTAKRTVTQWIEDSNLLIDVGGRLERMVPFGYQREPLDVQANPTVDTVVLMKSARCGGTTIILGGAAYFLAEDPAPVFIAYPTKKDIDDFYRREFGPLIENNPILSSLRRSVAEQKQRDAMDFMRFRGGASVVMRGAQKADAFRGVTARRMYADEADADGYAAGGKGSQGDKLALLEKRGQTVSDSQMIISSSPTIKGASRVESRWLMSDQRRYYVPCPHCGEMQYLKWGGTGSDYGIKWKTDDHGRVVDAWYRCEHCHTDIAETHKWAMDQAGEWRPTATPVRHGIRGYHIWAGMSLQEKASWRHLAQEWIESKDDPGKLQVFINTTLGEVWEDRVETKDLDLADLIARRQHYEAEVPDEVIWMTAGVDLQRGSVIKGLPPRAEISVWGWGRGEESWLIEHQVLVGEMTDHEFHGRLDATLKEKTWRKQNGDELRLQAAAFDMGYSTAEVRSYCAARASSRIWATKGLNSIERTGVVWPRSASKAKGPSYVIDTQTAKDLLDRRLKIQRPGPGYVHLPMTVGETYCTGLLAEHLVKLPNGKTKWESKGKHRNTGEAWDCLVYAYAALCGLKSMGGKWRSIEACVAPRTAKPLPPHDPETGEIIEPETPRAEPQQQQPAPLPAAPTRKRTPVVVRSSFMSRR